MGFFDKLNQFMASIKLGESNLSNPTKGKPKIRKKKSESSNLKLKQGVASLGVDIGPVLNDPRIKRILVAHAKKTCSEITTIPQQYRGKVAKAVLDSFYGTLPEGRSPIEHLQSICPMSHQEASLISRDQTSKLTSRLNQARQEAIGIEEYIWRAVIPRCNHSERNGKKYRWDSPPSGGHPGQSYLCSCIAMAVTDTKKIIAHAKRK
ncbi:MAG: phage minor head protein [Syntrophobacteraceae bacterium]